MNNAKSLASWLGLLPSFRVGRYIPAMRIAAAIVIGMLGLPASLQAGELAAVPLSALPQESVSFVRPLHLVDDPETIYAPLEPIKPNSGTNQGGVRLTLNATYFTDYVYRGIDRSEAGALNPAESAKASEDAPNLQFDGKLSFDLGRLPHPFIGLFVNVFNDDPVSRFQEIRPYFGLDWTIKPFTVTAGWQTFIFPERDDFNTNEVFAMISLNDAIPLGLDKPLFSPYVYGAYDLDRYNGFYIEAGIKHDFVFEDTGLMLTLSADVAFISGNTYFTARRNDTSGFQHYDLGLTATYSLNTLLNVSRRYGDWSVVGYFFYTDGMSNNLRADTQLWGGVGISFKY